MKTIDLDSLRASGINPLILIDTCDFMDYCIGAHGYTNSSFHDKIWGKMSNHFFDGPYSTFDKVKVPKNEFEEMLNAFLEDYPEFEGSVKMIFTN